MPQTIKLATYRLTYRVLSEFSLHEYAGSALRGAFGHALIQLCGLQISDVKNKTPLYLQSPYAEIFDPVAVSEQLSQQGYTNLPSPYVIKAPAQKNLYLTTGDEFVFELVLIGHALEHLQLIIMAFRRALQHGLGKNKTKKAALIEVEHLQPNGQAVSIYHQEQPAIKQHNCDVEIPKYSESATITIQLQTPLRLQHKGKILKPKELNAAVFIKNIIRRCSVYLNMQGSTIDNLPVLFNSAEIVQEHSQLEYQYWERYSNRQHKKLILDGAIGQWTLIDVPPQLLPFIYLGQFLHNGKGTVFGLGRYLIQEVESQ